MVQLTIDKNLPVSISVQIEGAIEFRIMSGAYRENNRLPTVRALSQQLGVAPMTVAKAYKALQNKGLLESVTGRGTFVVRDPKELARQKHIEELRCDFMALMDKAQKLDVDPALFITLINQREEQMALSTPLRILMVGNSRRINEAYIKKIKRFVGTGPEFDNIDFAQFDKMEAQKAITYNLILTIPHCISRIRSKVKEKVPILAPYLIPSTQTIDSLSKLPNGAVVGAISHFASFVPAMMEGIRRYAPQVESIHMELTSSSRLQALANRSDVIIYSTSALQATEGLTGISHIFEYAHTPETRYLKEILLPAVQRIDKDIHL